MSYSISYLDDTSYNHHDRLFNPHDPRYRCCFRCCHVRLGIVFICIVECLASSLAVSLAMLSYFSHGGRGEPDDPKLLDTAANRSPTVIVEKRAFLLITMIICVALAGAIFVGAFLTLYGVSRQRHGLIVPYLSTMIVEAILLLALICLLAWSTAVADKPHDIRHWNETQHHDRNLIFIDVLIVSLIAGAIGLILQVYFVYVTFQLYRYIKCRATYGRVASFALIYSGSS